ncbi:MAG: Ig-like domain-containing protein [Elusimicrobia bacterium]|nr:Ig-like domain-containing protein [Elusimicrobiota bacterium]
MDTAADDAVKPENQREGWGSYGGGDPGGRQQLYSWNKSPGILNSQYSEAANYTVGALMEASNNLPSLITTFTVTNQPVNTPQGVQITFDVMENRLAGVKVGIFVQETNQRIVTRDLTTSIDGPQSTDGKSYSDTSYGSHAWAEKNLTLYPTNISRLEFLPYMAHFTTEWHGELAGGRLAADVTSYTLVARVADGDGNSSEASYKFNVQPDTTPPTISWDVLNQYTVPSTGSVTGSNALETAPWFTGNYINFTVNDYGTGIGAFSVLSPEGTALFSGEFQNGRELLGGPLALPEDATGYMATAVDVLGNATTVYFHVARFFPEVTVSTIVITKSTGGYTLGVSGVATSSAGLAGPVTLGVRDLYVIGAPAVRAIPGAWPPGPSISAFSFDYPYPGPEPDTSFYLYDSAGLLGFTDMPTWRDPATGSAYEVRLIQLSDSGWSSGFYGLPLPIFDKLHYKIENPVPPAGCVWINTPTGMHVEVRLGQGAPDYLNYNNWVSQFSGITLIENYTQAILGVLADVYAPTETLVYPDSVLPRFSGFTFVPYANTNTGQLNCSRDTNGDGVNENYIDNYSTGTYYYIAHVDVTVRSSLMGAPLKPDNTHWVPAGVNVALTAGNLQLIFPEVQTGHQLIIGQAASYPTLTGWRAAGKDTAYDFSGNTQTSGNFTVKIQLGGAGLSEMQLASAAIYHLNTNTQTWEDITTGREAGAVIGVAAALSPFVVMAPVDDQRAPTTILDFQQGGRALVQDNLYISSTAYVNLYGDDFAIQGDISGVGAVNVLDNTTPSPGCLAAPYDPQAAQGVCANHNYAAPFRLNEGIHSLYYWAADKAGNSEVVKSTVVYVDGTPPETEFTVIGSSWLVNGSLFISADSSVALSAFDPLSNGVASGVKERLFYVNITPDSCAEPPTFTAVPGTCDNPVYSGPFTLPVGTHTVYYTAFDKVGNQSAVKTAAIMVLLQDTVPPATTLAIDGAHYAAEGKTYIAPSAKVTLAAVDPEVAGMFRSGVDVTHYLVDGDPATGTPQVYDQPFSLSEGSHVVYYRSVDKAGNAEVYSSATLHMDAAPPSAPVAAPLPQYSGRNDQTITWSASQDAASGVAGYRVYGCVVAEPAQTCVPQTLLGGTALTSYTDASVKTNNSRYFYSVRAYDNVGLTSEASNTVNITIQFAAAAFVPTGSMSMGRHIHTATLLTNGKALVAGGNNGGYIYLSSAELYDPGTEAFSTTGPMNSRRGRGHTATLLGDGRALITGGDNGATAVSSAELYDPVAGLFTVTGQMSAPRSAHTATRLQNGKVLITGGYNGSASLSLAELYDPATGAFSPAGTMNAARRIHTATLLADGRVLVAGGYHNGYLSSAELYDPATNTFSLAAGPMGTARAYHNVILLNNNKVLIVGGSSPAGPLSSAELFDPATGAFSPTGAMSTLRSSGHVIALANGKILVVGGDMYGSNNATSSAELYDPATGIFSMTAIMAVKRNYPTATLLGNGKVLVAGGYNGSVSVASAELYDTGAGVPVVLAYITVSPAAAGIAAGGTRQFTATARFSDGSSRALDASDGLSWSSDNTAVATVNSISGLAAGVADGTAHITALSGGKSDTATLVVDSVPPQLLAISAKPAEFNPSAGEQTRFVFNISEPATLNVSVKDAGGALVKALAVNYPAPGGTLSFYWDGRNGSAQLVPGGVYHVVVTAADAANNQAAASGGDCFVRAADYPSVTALAETPAPFFPGGSNMVRFSYHLSAAPAATTLPVTVTISHPVQGVIKTINLEQGQGDQYVEWDGLSALGEPAPDGVYSEKVAITVDGNTAYAQGAFSLLRNNVVTAQSGGQDPVVTVQYDNPAASVVIISDPTITTAASLALQSLAGEGTVLASWIYDIVAGQAFTTQPVLRFKYDPVYDGEALALYKYDVLAGAWLLVASSGYVDLASNEIIVTLNENVFMASLFALMRPRDSTAPVSTIAAGKPSFDAFGLKVITPGTLISVSAQDDGIGASGVEKRYCAVDSGDFEEYTAPFAITAQGEHTVRCRAKDKMGNVEIAKELRVAVMLLENEAVESATSLTVSGTANITGVARANAAITLNGNAKITGAATGSDVILKGKAVVTGEVTKAANTLMAEPVALGPIAQAAAALNNNSLIPAQYLINGVLKVSSKARLELPAGTYYFKGIELTEGALVALKGNTDIIVEGPVNISGGSAFNAECPASRLKLFVNSELPMALLGGGKIAGYVYAPGSALKLSGNGLASGHWFAKSVELSGNGSAIQSGDSLPIALPAVGVSGFLASADETFRLGEVYVFPNPAKAGARPVFHVETGIADSVRLLVYTVAGSIVHERTLTGPPSALDDGNGLSYAYEYAWDGHIPSGVYYYLVETAKAGQKLKRTGKFAVVR